MFKKFFSVLCVLALLAIPALAQNLDTKSVQLTATVAVGCSLEIVPNIVSWTNIPVPTIPESTFVDQQEPIEPIQVRIAGRLVGGHHGQFSVTTESFTLDGEPNSQAQLLVNMVWTASDLGKGAFPAQELMVPTTGDTIPIWTSKLCQFCVQPTLLFQFKNSLGYYGGAYKGMLIFQIMDE